MGEPQSNGAAEKAADTVGGMIRTQKIALESNCGIELAGDHVATPWLIQCSGLAVSLFEIGSDGRAAYERVRGMRFRRELPPFGETVFYLPTDRKRGRANKLQAKWQKGIYLGIKC